MTLISQLSRPLAAFYLGLAIVELRTLQASVWATSLGDIKDVSGCLRFMGKCEVVFVDQLGAALHQEYQALSDRINDRHELAASLGGAAQKDQKVFRHFQAEDWDKLLLLSQRVVQGHRRWQSWFAVGRALAEAFDAARAQRVLSLEADAKRVLAAVASLPPRDRKTAQAYLPEAYSPDIHDSLRWASELDDASGTLAAWLASPAAGGDESPVVGDKESSGGHMVQYVTLTQAALLVNRHKRTLEKYKDKMPLPQIEGGGGKPDEWDYSVLRPWLENKFGRLLPEQLPILGR